MRFQDDNGATVYDPWPIYSDKRESHHHLISVATGGYKRMHRASQSQKVQVICMDISSISFYIYVFFSQMEYLQTSLRIGRRAASPRAALAPELAAHPSRCRSLRAAALRAPKASP